MLVGQVFLSTSSVVRVWMKIKLRFVFSSSRCWLLSLEMYRETSWSFVSSPIRQSTWRWMWSRLVWFWDEKEDKLGLTTNPVLSELDLTYKHRYTDNYIPDAYEKLIIDCMRGDHRYGRGFLECDEHSHFVRTDELEGSWRIFTPLLHEIEVCLCSLCLMSGRVPRFNHWFILVELVVQWKPISFETGIFLNVVFDGDRYGYVRSQEYTWKAPLLMAGKD